MDNENLMNEARDWVESCSWKEDPEDIKNMSDAEIKQGVEQHYEGGWKNFRRSCK